MDSPVFPFLNIAESNKFISQAASDIFGSSFVVTPKDLILYSNICQSNVLSE